MNKLTLSFSMGEKDYPHVLTDPLSLSRNVPNSKARFK